MHKIFRGILAVGVLAIIFAIPACNYMGPCVNGSGPVEPELRDIENFTGVINKGSFEVYVIEAESFEVEVVAQENLLPIIETYVSGGSLIIETRNNTCYRSGSAVVVNVSLPELDHLRLSGSGKLIADVAEGPEVEVSNSGSGLLELDTVFAESCLVTNSGSGFVILEGVYADLADVVQSGSGTLDGGIYFGTADFRVRHSSSGQIYATLLDGTLVDVILSGSGKVEMEGNAVQAEYSLSSSGRLDVLNLEAADVEASSAGSGDIFLWATDILDATITGSGSIFYRGNPVLSTTITGSGSVRPY